jgi:hypothetical protein
MDDGKKITRRQVIGKAKYVAPLMLTFKAAPAFAKTGSQKPVRPGRNTRFKPRPKSKPGLRAGRD